MSKPRYLISLASLCAIVAVAAIVYSQDSLEQAAFAITSVSVLAAALYSLSLRRPRWAWALAITLGAFVGLYFAVVGWPRTPMTQARANRLFGQGLRPGQTGEEVKAWMASRGIRYEVLKRVERERDRTVMRIDGWGALTAPGLPGLDADSVYSVARVSYPDAARGIVSQTEITVYLLFDSKDRLLGHRIRQFHWGL